MKRALLIIYLSVFCFLFLPLFASGKKKSEKAPEVSGEGKQIFPVPPVVSQEPSPVTEKKEKLKGGIISGRIVDETGSPAADVEVVCVDEKGVTVARTFTDAQGNYIFENISKGDYTITVNYSGFTGPIEIKFKGDEKLPDCPAGIKLYETHRDIRTHSSIYAFWETVPGALAYRCELYIEGQDVPLVRYPDIKQNFCEFGNLEEDTIYEVRVYSKNERGYSELYASAGIQTINKPPLPPFGFGVTYAKNNRIDLIWDSTREDDLKGYVLQVRKEKGDYLYYSKEGLTSDRNKAYIIEYSSHGPHSFSIAERIDNTPIIENAVPYSFRVLAVDKNGAFSRPSTAIGGIVLEDTIPPNPPKNIKYEFRGTNRLRISWETDDRDIEKFVLYYGVSKDRWDGVVSTGKTYYDLIINSEKLRDKELLISIMAVDRAGNESGYKPFFKKTSVMKNESVTEDIVLSANNIYKDYSVAIRQPAHTAEKRIVVKKSAPSPPVRSRTYGFETLKKNGYVVKKGETANLIGKIRIPENVYIRVKSGGTLVVEDAVLKPAGTKWGGIQYLAGALGKIMNTELAGAAVAVAVLNNENGIRLRNVEVSESKEIGIHIKNSRTELSLLSVRDNPIGLYIENSRVRVANSIFEKNEKGILSQNYSLYIVDTQLNNNTVYGLRLYGGGKVVRCSFKYNLAGVVIESGKGRAELAENIVELNRMDGIVLNTSLAEIRQNLIANNGRHGIYLKEGSNPNIVENDIISNRDYAVIGGGRVMNCYIAYNNGSTYIDDTCEKGRPDNVFSSSSSGVIKQIFSVDYINALAMTSVLR